MINGIWMLILGATLLFASRLQPVKPTPAKAIAVAVACLLIGPISMLWGVWGTISAALNVAWITQWPVFWATYLASSLLQGVAGLAMCLRAPELLWAADLGPLRRVYLPTSIVVLVLGAWMIVSGFLFAVGGT